MSSDSDTSGHSIEYSNSDDESFNFARAARIRKPRILKSDSEEDISDVEEDDLITSDSEDDIKVSDESLNKSKSRSETQTTRGSNDSGKDQSIEDTNLENDVVSSDSESNEILKKTTLNHDTTNKNDSSDLNNISIHSLGNRKSLFSSSRVVPDIINSSSSENEETIDIIDDSDDVILRDSAENDQNQIIITDSETESSKTSQQSLDVESHLDVNEQSQQSVNQENNDAINVTSVKYFEQREKIRKLEMDLIQVKKALVMTKSSTLIDNGASIRQHKAKLESSLEKERKLLERMVVSQVSNLTPDRMKPKVPLWDDIRAGTSSVVPNTFGKQAMLTYNTQKALTLDLLEQMHQSLETCPKENTFAEDPKGLKVELMNHQRRGLAWLLWREKQKPSGGILADDMGLGKTLTMISLVLKTRELERMSKKYMDEDSRSSDDENSNPNGKKKNNVQIGGTLVVCPASLINQWSGEIDNRVKRGLISYEVFHGTKRETKASRLAQYDMVITTYGIASQKDIIDRIKWRRIILDEAHTIRNHRTLSSISICELSAKTRWAVTGTPVHNKEMDMYSLLKFLRCAPFDDLGVWKRWVGAKSSGGPQRLHTVTSSLMLRRTKEELKLKGALDCVPQRQWQIIDVQLEEPEMAVYQKMLLFSRNLFAQYLHQKAEKNTDLAQDLENLPPNSEYMKMRDKLLKMNKMQDVSASHILVLLLRLRQICCHPTLISSGISDDMDVEDDSFQEVNLMEQLNNLHLDDDDDTDKFADNRNEFEPQANVPLNEASKNVFNKSNPVFSSNYKSSKIAKMLEVLRDKILPSNDKTIIVSQWPSYLRITAEFLKQESIEFSQLDGTVPVPKRMAMVNDFNNPNHKVKVLLLSLTAGGVGLNLIGANHLILMDLHWNPQLENQAQDRIYRVGQKKTVYVYKFLVNETIEERILKLQDNKKNLAQEIITGSKQVMSSKLTLNDMRTLFNM